MILTGSASVHDGEQVDPHGDGVKDWQGLQSIGHRVLLQNSNEEVCMSNIFQQREI